MNNFEYWCKRDKDALTHFFMCDCGDTCGDDEAYQICSDFLDSKFLHVVDYLLAEHVDNDDKDDIDKFCEEVIQNAVEKISRADLQEMCDRLRNADLPEQLRLANNRISALERRNKQLEGQKEYYRELFSEMSTYAHDMLRIAERFGDA